MRPAAGIKKDALDFLPDTFRPDQEDTTELQTTDGLVHPRSANVKMSLRLRNSSEVRLWQNRTADWARSADKTGTTCGMQFQHQQHVQVGYVFCLLVINPVMEFRTSTVIFQLRICETSRSTKPC
jgi:hypothetical protein